MSLVGTRPPTVDEWDKYELHHRARLATKPGLTGMWQVSGRSNITDLIEVPAGTFEEDETDKEDGELESMVQRVYRQIRTVDTDATVSCIDNFFGCSLYSFKDWRTDDRLICKLDFYLSCLQDCSYSI